MIPFRKFTGGALETNAYCVKAPNGTILFDAPEGADHYFSSEHIDLLLLTHGHFDHIADAARICRRHHCQVGIHAESAPMLSQPGFFKNWEFAVEIETMQPDFFIEASSQVNFLGLNLQVFLVPGHCPGSLCFLIQPAGPLFCGDVLFRGGIGRCDLPGGDQDMLLNGILHQLVTLPGAIRVYSGHGPHTTIEYEKKYNPFLNSA